MDKRKIRKFERICRELAEFMEEIHETNPDINLFVAGECCTTANLIDTKGKSDDYWRHNQEECILSSVEIPHADCGGI